MAGAQANVALTISLNGAGNAAEAIERAQTALVGLEGRAKKVKPATDGMTAGAEKGLDKIREKSGDVESALKGVSDFAGKGKEELSTMGDAFGGVEAVMRLLPGPAGLVATGIAAAALSAKLLYDHLQQSEAKLRLLASGDAKKIGEQLGFGADQTVRISQALADLGDSTRPVNSILQQVAANAKAMGADTDGQAAAVAKFVAAWKEGPDAVRKVQGEVGALSIQVLTLSQLSREIGLDPKALGVDKSKTALEALIAGENEMVRARGNIAALTVKIADLESIAATGSLAKRISAQAEMDIAVKQRDEQQRRYDLDVKATQFRAKKVEAEQAFADVSKQTAAIQANADAAAAARGDKRAALGIKIAAIQRQQEVVEAAIAKQQDLVAKGTGKEAADRLAVLQLQAKQLGNQAIQIAEADKAERKAKASANAAEAASNRQALREAALAKLKAEAELDGVVTHEERLLLIDKEQQVAIANATASTKNAKVRAAKIEQIEAESATKRANYARELEAAYVKASEDGAKATVDGMAKTTERVKAADEAMASSAKLRAGEQADAARALGNESAALEIERAQAHADYAAAVKVIDADLAAAAQQVVAGSTDATALEQAAEAKRVAAKIALAREEEKIDRAKIQRDVQVRAAAADVLSQVAQTYSALGAAGNVYAGAFGASLEQAVSGFKKLDAAMADSKASAADVSAAVGQMAAGIAASWIDAEAQRTSKQLDAEEQRALSTATTEEQRAAVTAEFEAKKAKAVQDAEREKAGILALMEIANAAASYPNVPAMVAHGAAAALYGAVAGGIVGGSSAGGGVSAPAGGGFSAAATPTASASGSKGGGAIVNNFFGVYGTKQHLGRVMQDANRAMASSGYKGKGA